MRNPPHLLSESGVAVPRRVALLDPHRGRPDRQERINRLRVSFARLRIDCEAFDQSEEIDAYQPDCVLALSLQNPKLTKFPTYGFVDCSMHEFLGVPRLVRNLLSFDAYLTISPVLKRIVGDLLFSARKLGSEIAFGGVTFPATKLEYSKLDTPRLCYVASDRKQAGYDRLLGLLVDREMIQLYGRQDRWSGRLRSAYKGELATDSEEILAAYRNAGIGLCLNACEDRNEQISPRLFEIVASGAATIANRSEYLASIFGDSIFYIDSKASMNECAEQIADHVGWMARNPNETRDRIAAAHARFLDEYAQERCLGNFIGLHNRTLVSQCYVPAPSEKLDDLPSISYIVRAGSRGEDFLSRALDSLVAQNYPKLHVIFVLHKKLDWLAEFMTKYSNKLTYAVVETLGEWRSTSIIRGMAAVETDLFALLDDDDELHANHVRTLIRTLAYHDGRDWQGRVGLAYSASYVVADRDFFEANRSHSLLREAAQWRDSLLEEGRETRVMEHYRFFKPEEMANHFWYMSCHSWLARRELINDELLKDPETDMGEDLYFEMQLAQRTHFAFSGEVTAVHYYHGENSMFEDAHRHEYDTLRHVLRMNLRSFPVTTFHASHLSEREMNHPRYFITPFKAPAPELPGYFTGPSESDMPVLIQGDANKPASISKRILGLLRLGRRENR